MLVNLNKNGELCVSGVDIAMHPCRRVRESGISGPTNVK